MCGWARHSGVPRLNIFGRTIIASVAVGDNSELRRSQVLPFCAKLAPCLIGMEACASAHYWARELKKLGHDVRLMPARDVRAYVKRGKNDAIEPIAKIPGCPRTRASA
jgi:transposase